MCKRTAVYPFLMIGLVFAVLSCGGSGGGGSSGGSGDTPTPSADTVTITGAFSGVRASVEAIDSASPQKLDFNANQVAKVLVVGPQKLTISSLGAGISYQSQLVPVTNGTFSVRVGKDTPVGMIFVREDNGYLGYLSLKNGISSLPMSMVKGNVNIIDLGRLTISGNIVEPSNDPFSSAIEMTASELQAYGYYSSMFTIVRNPDVDGNGVIDLLESKRFFAQIIYTFTAGSFDGNLTPTLTPLQSQEYFLDFFASESTCPSSVSVTGPEGSPFATPTTLNQTLYGSLCSQEYRSNDSTLLPGGTYKVQYPDPTITLNYNIPDQTMLTSDMVLIVPAVTLNPNGTIKKISWTYQLNKTGESVDPTSIIGLIRINMSSSVPVRDCGSNPTCDPYGLSTIFADPANAPELDVSDKNIVWSQINLLIMGYDDLFGSLYNFNYTNF